ncbi:MAG: ArsA family ATPase [Methylococcaceae bacterium]|nr:ArsA family ATPase [Methylococcaceae bacterium]
MKVSPAFLRDTVLKLVFFGGKGGVGKTTCACATALKLAEEQAQKSFLLVSTDPAHSLLDVFGDWVLPENLQVRELDASASLQAFKARYDPVLNEIAARGTFLDQDDLRDLMNLSLPGMDEVAAYIEIADCLKQDRYDCLIVDTAPTGHTLRLLEMPELIRRWLIALDTLLAKHRYIRRHFSGDNRLDHLDRFLLEMDDSVKTMQKSMTDPRLCRFVIVMQGEVLIVDETVDLARELSRRKIPMTDVVVNQLLPVSDCPVCSAGRRRQWLALEGAAGRLPKKTDLWTLPLFPEEPRGEALNGMWSQIHRLDEAEPTPEIPIDLPATVEEPIPLPPATLRLLIFVGKGGVGKTTLACATALRLRGEYPNLRILLFSLDPAHSLSDCLGVAVQEHPSMVMPGLDAQEINAEAAFAAVRREYRKELEAFLADTLPNLDITFDREVMEHLLDLAPPGLDEIMALTSVMEHLGGGHYDMVVLDSAPSGHLLRLLELPELIGDWLKLFFSLLLKYRRVMRLPRLSQRLVKLSRELKLLRQLLRDPAQTALYTASIPTHLAMDKTAELAQALYRFGINSSAVFINQITPANDCILCRALNQREKKQMERAMSLFNEQRQVRIYKQKDPSGLDGLKVLGSLLYARIGI